MDIKLDHSVECAINSVYSVEPSILTDILNRQNIADNATKTIKAILDNAPPPPPELEDEKNIIKRTLNKLNYDYKLTQTQISQIKDELLLLDAEIDLIDEVIAALDGKALDLINQLNSLITEVANAYKTRVSIGCRSDLVWKQVGSSTFTFTNNSSTTTTSYRAVKNSSLEVVEPYYGTKYYKKPLNRDYGTTLVTQFSGYVGVGSSVLIVLDQDALSGVQTGDTVSDDLDNPTAFTTGNLPEIIGIGSAYYLGVTTSVYGSISVGSSIISYNGIGDTSNINIDQLLMDSGSFSSGTKVVGFGTTSYSLEYIDENEELITQQVIVSSILLNKVAISSISNSPIGFGSTSLYDALFLSESSNIELTSDTFTVLRSTSDPSLNFDYNQNPSDPIKVGIINEDNLGVGHSVALVNNGKSPGPKVWKVYVDKKEPDIGAGSVVYYTGNTQWPYVSTLYGGFYPQEGKTYVFSTAISGPGYVGVSSTGENPSGPLCAEQQNLIDIAEENLQNGVKTILPQIQTYITSTKPIRYFRDGYELNAWSYLTSLSYLNEKANELKSRIEEIQSIDYDSLL